MTWPPWTLSNAEITELKSLTVTEATPVHVVYVQNTHWKLSNVETQKAAATAEEYCLHQQVSDYTSPWVESSTKASLQRHVRDSHLVTSLPGTICRFDVCVCSSTDYQNPCSSHLQHKARAPYEADLLLKTQAAGLTVLRELLQPIFSIDNVRWGTMAASSPGNHRDQGFPLNRWPCFY